MKVWVVRFLSLLAFNVVTLLVIGWLTPARVGWAALWAGIVLTALALWIKPLVTRWFHSMAEKSATRRTKVGQKIVEFLLALAVAFLVWVVTVLLSGVSIGGGFFGWIWGWVLPPVILLIGWAIYDAIDDKVEERAGSVYDRAMGGPARPVEDGTVPPVPPAPETSAAKRELKDGLTDEQRRMLDELGS